MQTRPRRHSGRRNQIAILLVSVAFFASSCGGGSGDAADSSTDDSTQVAGSTEQDTADFTPTPADSRAIELVEMVEENLGSEDNAFDALVLALDRGYSTSQVEDSIESNSLQITGRILTGDDAEVPPSGPPLGRVTDDRDLETSSAAGLYDAREWATPEVRDERSFKRRQDNRLPIPLTEIRRDARQNGRDVGVIGTLHIILLVTGGFEPEDIVEAVIVGGYRVDDVDENFVFRGVPQNVTCPIIRTFADPVPAAYSPQCFIYDDNDKQEWVDRSEVYPRETETTSTSGSGSSTEPELAETVPIATRTWEGRFVATEASGSGAWSTVDTTLIRIEEQADGSMVMTRQTDSNFEADPAIFSPPCNYFVFDTGTLTSVAPSVDGRLRFTGTKEVVYDVRECADSGPKPGTSGDLMTGTIEEDVLTLDTWLDGEGPAILSAPTTSDG